MTCLALNECGVQLDWLLVPKVEDAADLQALHAWVGARYERLTALIETPRGVENARRSRMPAASSPR